ncbi:MAG: transcription termination/antitermination protein NusA [Clostridiales bacterium]|nr:transcription termination/antitermination protein NusA [Clostridiales bacterium]
MKNEELLLALQAVAKERGLEEEVLFEAVEEALVAAFKREFADAKENEQVFAEIDRETGEISVYEEVEVVAEVTNPNTQISLEEAKEIDPDLEEGDTIEMNMDVESLGRLAAKVAKDAISKKLRDTENNRIESEFSDRQGELATGVIQRSDNRFVFVDIGRAEATLPRQEQVKDEDYSFNKRMKFLILRVQIEKERPMIIVSRSHPNLVRKLLEQEVPEIHDGIVEIVNVAREAGSRSKVAVVSRDPDVDPLGACVGQRGARIQAIMDELGQEKIDVIQYSEDPAVFISNALSPAKVERVDTEIITNEDGSKEMNAQVIVPDQQYSLAIGRAGQNVRLAARLTGWKIDIKSSSQFQQMVQNDLVENFTVVDDESSDEQA